MMRMALGRADRHPVSKRIASALRVIHTTLSVEHFSINMCRLSPSGSSDQYCGWPWGGPITTWSPKWIAIAL